MFINKKITLFILTAVFLVKGVVDAKETLTRYNITTSDEKRFVWFRVAKVGTRSILHLLENHFPLNVNGYGVDYNASNYKGYFKFAFVRNPWDRVVSCYCNKVLTEVHPPFKECFGKSFEYFVNFISKSNLKKGDIHIRLQSCLFPVDEVHFIGRLESFEEDVKYVFNLLDVEDVHVPQRNKSQHKHYSHFYTKKTRKIIAEKYKIDIDLFSYEYESD